MKKFVKVLSCALAVLLMAVTVGCSNNEKAETTSITLLTRGWINVPTTDDDPYKKWILDNYDLNVNLSASAGDQFGNKVQTSMASLNKPDVVAFPDLPSFNKIEEQGMLIDDWTPYLEQMPNMKAFINSDEQKSLKQLFTSDDGKLRALWTTPNATTWSLKVREDWAQEYRNTTVAGANNYYPAGNVATDGGPWQPKTDKDLLNFARFIKMTKNTNSELPDYFGFTAAGSGISFGTMGDWVPMMWGYVNTPPYGIYVDPVTNEANYSVVDGTFEPMLNFLRTVVSEKLIDPKWFTQKPSDDQRTKSGKIGMTWYTSVISEMTANYNPGVDTSNWWKTYCIPKADASSPIGGTMLTDSVASSIISVSARTALNKEKMDKICKLVDDTVCYYDNTKTGADKYVRGKAYDALKWGVGVDGSLKFEEIADTDYEYICVRTGDSYRETGKGNGAWDWGAWFSTTNDGIIQGDGKTVSPVVLKSAEHNLATASYPKALQVGSFLKLNQSTIDNMSKSLTTYMYNYVTQEANTPTIESYINSWRTTYKGNEILAEATKQFKEQGFTTKG